MIIRYKPEVGDIVVGRVSEVKQKYPTPIFIE
jgi:exosome complex RNA-binding protein Rrp4